MAGELRLDQHLPGKLVDAYVWRDATQAEVWQVSEAAFAADSLNAREHGAVPLVAQTPNTDGTVDYVGDLPAGLPPGTYWVSYYQRVGASVSLADYGPLAGEAVTGGTVAVVPGGGAYTDAARVTRRVSTLGVDLRTDADPGGGMAEALESAAADVEFYCLLRYDAATLATSRWVQRVATDLAVYYLCLLRLGPVSKAVQEQADRAWADLEKVKADVWAIPGIPQGRSAAPTVTNFSVNGRRYPATRVERPRSTGDARGYKRRIDYPADYLDRG